MPELVDIALWYADVLAWAVFPLHTPDSSGACSCPAGAACGSAGKHPRTAHGVHDASKDKAQIKDWWRQWPDANIGLATGEPSGVVVIDVDPRNDGTKTLAKLSERPPRNLIADTGGGGRHYFAAYAEAEIKSKAGRGIDVQADGRIVVLPPSLHASGNHYRWRKPPKRGIKLRPLPAWALESVGKRKAHTDVKVTVYRAGDRNNALASVAGRWRRAGMEPAELLAGLRIRNDMWCDPPLAEREVRAIANSIGRYSTPSELNKGSGIQELNDKGNAYRLQELHGLDMRFVPRLGWLTWDKQRWRPDGLHSVKLWAMDVGQAVVNETVSVEDEKELRRYQTHVNYCGSERGIAAMVKMAESLPGVVMHQEEFDADSWLFNVRNGTLELRSGSLREHRREDYITKVAPVEYNSKAEAPRFALFLQEIFKRDQGLIEYLQKFFGYCLTGDVSEHVFPIFWGTAQNGKSTLLEHAIPSVFGPDYQVRLTSEALLEKRWASHPTEFMDLQGARLAVAIESGKRRTLDEETIKQLTGGDSIKARRMHQNFERFTPTQKLVLVTNNRPRTSADEAIKRRLRLIPFTYRVPDALRDKELPEKLKAESQGILNWMLAGCLRWQIEGLQEPEIVIKSTSVYMEDQDLFGLFVKDAAQVGSKYRCSAKSLYSAYQMWCVENGIKQATGMINFNREVVERTGAEKYRSEGQVRWKGIRPLMTIVKSSGKSS